MVLHGYNKGLKKKALSHDLNIQESTKGPDWDGQDGYGMSSLKPPFRNKASCRLQRLVVTGIQINHIDLVSCASMGLMHLKTRCDFEQNPCCIRLSNTSWALSAMWSDLWLWPHSLRCREQNHSQLQTTGRWLCLRDKSKESHFKQWYFFIILLEHKGWFFKTQHIFTHRSGGKKRTKSTLRGREKIIKHH